MEITIIVESFFLFFCVQMFSASHLRNNVVTCCVENAQPFWIISKSKNLLGVLHLKPAGEYGFVTEATGADVTSNFKSQYLNRNSINDSQQTEYYVYISFNAENDNLMKWIKTAVFNLEQNGFKSCFPPRDFDVGSVHVDQISTEIADSSSYLVILSDDYLKSQFQMIELNKIWPHYKTNISRNIVVINYDMLDSWNIKDKRLKAFVRLEQTCDF
ncbi:Hypothetical predicted protein [Mytilus galloprovincialis]|uniref:TIR domain-containing protein n=1 Tax=Mytilus galloprovincialis TaxID=29158 RepID=A0A8B6ENE8_MYTGA|nr:Hypothetical predicted protein [Mytilus galloprovincialis]